MSDATVKVPCKSRRFPISGFGAMLPQQPFYRPLRQLPLEVHSRPPASGRPYCVGTYSAEGQSQDASTLVLVCVAPVTESCPPGDSCAMIGINRKAHDSAPLTMVNISPFLDRTVVNRFIVWREPTPTTVVVRVVEAEKVAEDQVLSSIDETAPYAIRREDTAALVKAYFAEADQTIVENLQVSLVCPLAKRKIRVPCRGARCHHAQCFDAYAYLGLNERTLRPSWSCPICSQQALLEDMRVDLFTLDVLRKADDQCVAVSLRPDGSWAPAADHDDHSVITIEDSPAEETEMTQRDPPVIDLTIDSD